MIFRKEKSANALTKHIERRETETFLLENGARCERLARLIGLVWSERIRVSQAGSIN